MSLGESRGGRKKTGWGSGGKLRIRGWIRLGVGTRRVYLLASAVSGRLERVVDRLRRGVRASWPPKTNEDEAAA